jgi:hypothetical protein
VTPRHDFVDSLLTEHPLACFLLAGKNNRLEKSVVQIYTKNGWVNGTPKKILSGQFGKKNCDDLKNLYFSRISHNLL